MVSVGYKLSSEEHNPGDLVRYARLAEDSGFSFALISDHCHPWTDKPGQSAFVWSVLGAVAHATQKLEVRTAVTCPTVRLPSHFEAAAELRPGGYDHVCVHQVGPDQEGFIDFYARDILPKLRAPRAVSSLDAA